MDEITDKAQLRKTIDALLKVCQNIVSNPLEEKYRLLKKSNNFVSTNICAFDNAKAFLELGGFEES